MNVWLPLSTAFLASAVEAVEALTVVLAVGVTHGWRAALSGALWAIVALAAGVAIAGPAIVRYVPLDALRLVVGIVLVLFGMSWQRKAILRYGGRRALRDEAANFERRTRELQGGVDARGAQLLAFKTVLLEGLEVAIIVVTVGSSAPPLGLWAAGAGAAAAVLLVVIVGYAVRAPLARVPENALAYAVGVMLCAFGTLWSGEGLGIAWQGDDAAIVALALGFALLGAALVAALRALGARAQRA